MGKIDGNFEGKNQSMNGQPGFAFRMLHRACGIAVAVSIAVVPSTATADEDAPAGIRAAFAAPFSTHAVLQRGCPLPVWGSAAPGSDVSVTLDSMTESVKADADGCWKVVFPAQDKPGLGHRLLLSVDGAVADELDDIAIGDVWLCSGQSNMEMSYDWIITRGKEDIEKADDLAMRLLHVWNAASPVPLSQPVLPITWTPADFANSRKFSACGWFFGQTLRKAMPDIPIGLIDATWNGSPIQTWLSDTAFRSAGADCAADSRKFRSQCGESDAAEYVRQLDEWRAAGSHGEPPKAPETTHRSPSACFNAMLHPLFPLAVKGAVWYQGCNDVGNPGRYARVFRALAADWRTRFTHPDGLPIYIVQLAAFMKTHDSPLDSAWARMRWTQMRLGESIEKSGTAVAIDVGDHRDIHPKDKKTVGERLARLALARTYGLAGVVEAGPIPQAATLGGGAVSVTFKNTAGLSTSDGGTVSGFQLVAADGQTVWADATISGDLVSVTVPENFAPVKVRFAWDDYPDCNLVNGDNLPCGPFEFPISDGAETLR